MEEFDRAVKDKGGRFLEAPVSGSKVMMMLAVALVRDGAMRSWAVSWGP
jgi:3-hydroxyisobutyrate dehydrogenase-like beta-hydroxyacid dehydrogenase